MAEQKIVLYKGAHEEGECADGQRCLFEWYNWLTRQRNTDACPPGVSPVLHQFGVALNDVLPDDRRQELARFLPNGEDRLAGTADDGLDEARGFLALDWLARTNLPAWLDAAGLDASAVRALPPLTDLAAVRAARPVLDAAGAAARAAAWDAAGAAAGDAAWDAAWAAARDAAWDAAGAAAWDAAWAAARDAAWDAAWDAARAAARAALAPTVARLQDSAIALYERMITPEASHG